MFLIVYVHIGLLKDRYFYCSYKNQIFIALLQANHCRPLIDIPEDIFYYDYDTSVNLTDFSRRYRLEQQEQTPKKTCDEESKNILQFLTTNVPVTSSSTHNNLFIKFARWNRTHFIDYERTRYCLIDGEKSKQEGLLEYLSSLKGSL